MNSHKAITILGAGGHAKEVLDVLLSAGYTDIRFFDSYGPEENNLLLGYPILRTTHALRERLRHCPDFVIGVGKPILREKLTLEAEEYGGSACSCIAPTAVISDSEVSLEAGLNIMHQAFISASTKIGEGSLINTGASIHHDVAVGRFAEVSPGARLLGGASIGDYCRIGANAAILPKVSLPDRVVVGAGAVVTKTWPAGTVLTGIPARPQR